MFTSGFVSTVAGITVLSIGLLGLGVADDAERGGYTRVDIAPPQVETAGRTVSCN